METPKQDSILFEELLHTDAPLATAEILYSEETAEYEPWFSAPFKLKPYIIINRKAGLGTYFYYDPKGVEWMKEQAGKYKETGFAIKEMEKRFGEIDETLKNGATLGRSEYLEFINKVHAAWPWFNYMWWAIEYKEANREPFADLLALRKKMEYFAPGVMTVARNSIKAMYPTKAKYADVISTKEIEENKLPDDRTLEERLKGYVYFDFKFHNSLDDLLRELNVKIVEHAPAGDVLKGQTAFPGKVTGVVRIVDSRDEMVVFQKNEIMVSGTTIPDFLPAMKRAAAIVSEHGGAICHAAITSRELKIPCVVGVKGATKALHNGDLVEVDAGAGVINILKRA